MATLRIVLSPLLDDGILGAMTRLTLPALMLCACGPTDKGLQDILTDSLHSEEAPGATLSVSWPSGKEWHGAAGSSV